MDLTRVALLIVVIINSLTWIHGQGVFRLANTYGDDMVLQMSPKRAQIWGFGEPDAQIKVTLDTLQIYTAVDGEGEWRVHLLPQPAGGPRNIQIDHAPITGDAENITLTVWFGDVWVCSGQSNMEMKLKEIFNATEEIEIARTYTNIRIMQISRMTSDVELVELNGTTIPWSKTDIPEIGEFSAACLLFGERITALIGAPSRPLGLIEASWPGTRIEAWSSTRVTDFCNTPLSNETNRNGDHVLWNGMIKPLTSLTVRGALWYQGENNVNYNADYYACHIQRLSEDWKNNFFDGTVAAENGIAFPFGIFQLGPTGTFSGNDAEWGALRWHQTVDLGTVPNVFLGESFMAAGYDLTDPRSPTGSVHPRDKQTVCSRLANSAAALLYDAPFHLYGPAPALTMLNLPGQITVTYDRDITVKASNGFYYQDLNRTWHPASITAVSGRDVIVTFDPAASHLAYGWATTVCDYKNCAIYSNDSEELPAQIWLWNLSKI